MIPNARDAGGARPVRDGARTVGVEEELLLLSGAVPRAEPVGQELAEDPATGVEHELKLEQAEIATRPAGTLDELHTDLRQRRTELIGAAAERGVRVAALATSPVRTRPTATPDERYARMVRRFAKVAEDQLTCGAHVHVSVASRAEGVAAIDGMRAWLPVLTALMANSPFWSGQDTGYASYRTVAWGSWPTAGPTAAFGDEGRYDEVVGALISSGAALDDGMIYFDARLSARYPTVEIRVADVGLEAADTVLHAALCRGLVETAVTRSLAGEPGPDVHPSLLRAASWTAARYGMSGELFDVLAGRNRPALELLDRLLDEIGPALRRAGDEDAVRRGLERVRARGFGSEVQRQAFAARGRIADVVDDAVARTSGARA